MKQSNKQFFSIGKGDCSFFFLYQETTFHFPLIYGKVGTRSRLQVPNRNEKDKTIKKKDTKNTRSKFGT